MNDIDRAEKKVLFYHNLYNGAKNMIDSDYYKELWMLARLQYKELKRAGRVVITEVKIEEEDHLDKLWTVQRRAG